MNIVTDGLRAALARVAASAESSIHAELEEHLSYDQREYLLRIINKGTTDVLTRLEALAKERASEVLDDQQKPPVVQPNPTSGAPAAPSATAVDAGSSQAQTGGSSTSANEPNATAAVSQ